jgi:ankyrin repeat protein
MADLFFFLVSLITGRDILFLLVGMTPMSYAAHEGKTQVIRYLLDRGVDPAMPDERGTTPLHNAALQGALSHSCCYFLNDG